MNARSDGEEERSAADREKEARRAYRERNAERVRAGQRAWRERNQEHIRAYRAAYNAEHREEVLAKNREYMKRYGPRKAAERRRKEAKRASSKKYYEAHKAEHHEYSRQWQARKRAEDPEGYRAMRAKAQRRWWEAHKDEYNAKLRAQHRENPEPKRAAARAYYAAHADELKAKKRAYYAANRERVLASNRAWKEREKRRLDAGLPPRRLHTTSGEERSAHAAAADAFFTRERSPAEIAAMRDMPRPAVELLQATPPELVAAFERDSKRARIEHALATDLSYADRSRIAEARRHLAAHEQAARREQRHAAENARLDAIGKQVNDRLRHKEPPRRRHHLDPDPAAPHPMLNPHTPRGMNR
ncbi:hypothetical protein JNB63_17425 [Microbacterium trichothecenolyticum]|uniref:hypothetical protein n=1 Tax=Microbacterium trichothecenolyticum TaxID=69370 RepID=UPI001C6E2DAE|nr:hypothetical protein [Microbacterium trichothecenolyticum]MBW9121881.1 hypothetical protein [Microbacterium trichothecenolyticum]